MQTFKVTINREDLRSRVCSLFPYCEMDENGVWSVQQATNSVDGSYGRFMANIKLPYDVNLSIYEPIQNIGDYDSWDDTNTVPYGCQLPIVNYNSPALIRRVESFTYIERTEDIDESIYVEHEPLPMATYSNDEHVKVPIRDNYGHQVTCDDEPAYRYYDKQPVYGYYRRNDILIENNVYSYRTLMNHYYAYRTILHKTNPFIMFIEKGIGRVVVDRVALGLDDYERYPLVPDVVYYSEARDLANDYYNLARLCDIYNQMIQQNSDFYDSEMCCKCTRYEQMGGDIMLNYLNTLETEAMSTSEEYFWLAIEDADTMTPYGGYPSSNIDFSIRQEYSDLGYMSSYINEFIPGNRYYHGEYLTYNGETYIVQLNRYEARSHNNYPFILMNGHYMKLNDNDGSYREVLFYYYAGEETLDEIISQLSSEYYGVVYNGTFYDRNQTNITNDIHEYTTGIWNDFTGRLEFDAQHIIPLKEIIENEWYDSTNPDGYKYRLFNEVTAQEQDTIDLDVYNGEYLRIGNTFYKWDNEQHVYGILEDDSDFPDVYTVSGVADSKLFGLRGSVEYTNSNGEVETPTIGYDWLYYYRMNRVESYQVITDEDGNITSWHGEALSPGQTANYLNAYGNVIDSITNNPDERTITIRYIIGCHLLATYVDSEFNEDGSVRDYYSNFRYDENDEHGIIYTETYRYLEGSELDELCTTDDDFMHYVRDEIDEIDNFYNKYLFYKFEMYPTGVATVNFLFNNQNIQRQVITSEYVENVVNEIDQLHAPLFKKDYFVGVTYEPVVTGSINIVRGNAAAYERFSKLGEVRTMDDLENYANGGFFNIQSDT